MYQNNNNITDFFHDWQNTYFCVIPESTTEMFNNSKDVFPAVYLPVYMIEEYEDQIGKVPLVGITPLTIFGETCVALLVSDDMPSEYWTLLRHMMDEATANHKWDMKEMMKLNSGQNKDGEKGFVC